MSGLIIATLIAPAIAEAQDSKLKEITITDSQTDNKPPIATFTCSASGESATLDASGSVDPDGSITQYMWDFGDGSLGTGTQVQHTYTTRTNAQVTLTVLDNNNGVSLTQQTIVLQEPVNLAVNFQPSNAAVPAGFVVDSGSAFDSTKGYGWVVMPSSSGTRDRDSSLSPDQAYDTMIHVVPTAKWEATLPAGTYSVTICAGDPGYPVGTQAIQAEGTTVIAGETLSSTKKWIEKTSQITVNDGKLTLTFTGSTDPARLCWIKITNN